MHLCELFSRWHRSDPNSVGPKYEVLKDNFARDLREGPMKIKLEQRIGRNPTLAFAAVCTEAFALVREAARREAWACWAYVTPPLCTADGFSPC